MINSGYITDKDHQPRGENVKEENRKSVQRPSSNEMDKCKPTPPFFSLPRELRDEIYRAVHLNPRPIGANCSTWDHETTRARLRPFSRQLSAQAFRVCRQWHDEGRRVLYGENVFGLAILVRDCTQDLVEQAVDAVRDKLFPLEMVTRIHIVIRVHYRSGFRLVRALVGILAWALTIPTKLQWLNIYLRAGEQGEFPCRDLDRLASVRNVGHVSFHYFSSDNTTCTEFYPSISGNYQLYLRSVMEETPLPVENLPSSELGCLFKMYSALVKYSRGYDCEVALELASDAMVDCNMRLFKGARQRIMNIVNPKGENIPKWLTEHDPDSRSRSEG